MSNKMHHRAIVNTGIHLILMIAISPIHGCGAALYLPLHESADLIPKETLRPIESYAVTLGHSLRDRPIKAFVFGQGDDVTLLIATIHGNESAGTPLLNRLADFLKSHPDKLYGRRVVTIPIANPDGLKRSSRHNIRRVDLNRNFPALNRKDRKLYGRSALSEPEAQAIDEAIRRFRPDRIVSIHQPASCVDYDGPAEDLAKAIAHACDLKVKRLGGRPGSLGSFAGEMLGIPIVTLELPSRASRMEPSKLWDRFGPAMITAIEYAAK
jgi:protein MpaA